MNNNDSLHSIIVINVICMNRVTIMVFGDIQIQIDIVPSGDSSNMDTKTLIEYF